jgi:long-chain acyl-CoA synthetase
MIQPGHTSEPSSEPRSLAHWIDALDRYGDRNALIAFDKDGVRHTSYAELDALSGRFAAGLVERDIGRGDRLALLAPSSLESIAALLGTFRAGATPVPLDVQLDDDALRHVLDDSRPRWVLATTKQAARLDQLGLDQLPEVVLLDDRQDRRSWEHVRAGAAPRMPRPSPEDEAVLFYTSGTTGPPKGVPLTHQNIAVQLNVLLNADLVNDGDCLLLPLPLHHVYPLVVGLLTPLARGLSIVLPYALTGPQMVRALNEGGVTIVIGVPRLYRALYDGIVGKAASSGRIAKAGFHLAMGISSWLRRRTGIRAGKWLLRPLHRQFGARLRVVASGGSPLDDELAWKLEALGWQVAIGYGLTETSPLLTLNPPGQAKIGSVGRAIANVELRIDQGDDVDGGPGTDRKPGEILARGPSVFGGYHDLPDKTEEVLTEDGWFHTGDLGFVDDDGFLHLTGRKGTMIVTESGENVQPDEVESAYAEHPAIQEIGVLDVDGRLAALIVPETAEVSGEQPADAILRAVETRSRDLPSYQRLAEFHLTRQSLPRTRLGKIQRHKLRDRFQQAVENRDDPGGSPIAVEEMNSEDRALLDDPSSGSTWELLSEKYAQRRLTPDTHLRLDLEIDSLEWMNLSLDIRRRARVEIDEEVIDRIETVRDLLTEVSQASSASEPTDQVSPLADPEAALSDAQRRNLRPHGRLASMLARGIFAVNRRFMRLVFRLRVVGADRLPAAPIVIVPNHASYLDAPAIAAALSWQRLRQTYWGGWTGTMFANMLMRLLSRLTHVVPVDPQRGVMSSLAFGAAVITRGHNLVWFPEGERSADGQLKPFRSGIGLLLQHHEARVVPTVIEGSHAALPPGRWLPRPRPIRVTFGRPLDVHAVMKNGDDDEPSERITIALQDAVAAVMGEPDSQR